MISEDLTSSLEKYLDAVAHLEDDNKVARAKDIAETMNVSMASVTQALRNLSSKDLINYDPYKYVTLTPKGRFLSDKMKDKQLIIRNFFEKVLQIPDKLANTSACKIEHVIDDEVLTRFVQFIDFIDNNPKVNFEWVEDSGHFSTIKPDED